MAVPKRSANIPIHLLSCAASRDNRRAADQPLARLPVGLPSLTGLARGLSVLAGASLSLGLCLAFGSLTAPASAAQRRDSRSPSGASSRTNPRAERTPTRSSAAAERELRELAQALSKKYSPAVYKRLAVFAARESRGPLGARAALALGFSDYNRNQFADARNWFLKGESDPLLREYALYWLGMTDHSADEDAAAARELAEFRRRYPNSVMSEPAVEALAQSALSANRPDEALAALGSYSRTTKVASLLLLRAQAHEQDAAARGTKPLAAARDYLRLYYHFPLSDEAMIASGKIPLLRSALGDQFPETPLETEIARAEALFYAGRWADLQAAYRELLPRLSGESLQRADLRIAQAAVQTGADPTTLASLKLSNPDLDAERIFYLSQAQRSADAEKDMLAAVDQLVSRYPHSYWTERALFAAGNYYWVNLQRDRAAQLYQSVFDHFPDGRYADLAQWRIIWTAYLGRQSGVRRQFEQYIRRFPSSSYVDDALYFLGRANERAGDKARARSFYLVSVNRFPQTYFGELSAERLRAIGRRPAVRSDLVSVIPRPSRLHAISDPPLPLAARRHWRRAQALQTISFDKSAALELRAAYAETHSRRLLLDAAQASNRGGLYRAGILMTREVVPDMDARQFGEVPQVIWRTAYPLPYRSWLDREARRNHLDPMLLAGLIRQESAFASDALSHSGAMGLMQVMPATGYRVARSLRLRFSRAELFDPQYNLRLGSHYLSGLLGTYGKLEEAVAAYNAGPIHVTAWTDGQNYQEMAEFVESIPFTETRDYVQLVLRNAAVYRRLYQRRPAPKSSRSRATSPR